MSGQAQTLRPPAQNWQEVDLHVRYAQDGLARVEGKLDALLTLVPKMATTDYIDAKFDKLADEYAQKSAVIALEAKVAEIEHSLNERSVQSTVERWGNLAQKFAAIIAFGTGAVYFLHGLLEKVK